MKKPGIILANEQHNNEALISLTFEKDQSHLRRGKLLISRVKTLPGAKWSQSRKFWYLPAQEFSLNKVFETLQPVAFLDYSALQKQPNPEKAIGKQIPEKLKPELPGTVIKKIESFRLWMEQNRYRFNTINAYADAIATFLGFYKDKEPVTLNNDHLIEFNKAYIIQRNYSVSYQNQVINAIKLFYSKELKSSMNVEEIERPRRRKSLPKVIAKSTIQKMLTGITNSKHKTALTLVYGLGLRRSELINMQISDLDFERKTVMIRDGKGGKDRTVPLSDKLIRLVKQQITAEKPQQYVIEGVRKGAPYSAASLTKIFDNNLSKVAGGHNFSLHSLRHSYATHLLEAGVDLRYIQELLGHKSSKTTEIYTHVSMKSLSNIKNPTDDFDI